MSEPPRITVGVPGYLGHEFMAESLASVQAQTYRHLDVVISLDGPQPDLEAICRPFLRDSRFRLATQPARRGWVGNINWLIAGVETDYWCYQQQDDILDPSHLEALVDCAESCPEVSVAYTDILTFGDLDQTVVQPSVGGTSSGRQLALLYDHHAAVAFRGLTRLRALRDAGTVRTNDIDNFAVDTVWVSAMARAGELRRVPGLTYRKRFHGGNEHTRWVRWPEEQRVRAWQVHCAQMLDEAALCLADVDERRLLWAAVLTRLVTARAAPEYLSQSSREPEGRALLVRGFLRHVRQRRTPDVPAWLGLSGWPAVRRWTRRWLQLQPVGGHVGREAP